MSCIDCFCLVCHNLCFDSFAVSYCFAFLDLCFPYANASCRAVCPIALTRASRVSFPALIHPYPLRLPCGVCFSNTSHSHQGPQAWLAHVNRFSPSSLLRTPPTSTSFLSIAFAFCNFFLSARFSPLSARFLVSQECDCHGDLVFVFVFFSGVVPFLRLVPLFDIVTLPLDEF